MLPRGRDRLFRVILIGAGVLLALDTFVLARRMSLFRLPGEMDAVALARQSGYAVASELRRVARAAGVSDEPGVVSALSSLDTALGLAVSPADVARALSCEGRAAEDAVSGAQATPNGVPRAGGAGPLEDGGQPEGGGSSLRERLRLLQDQVGTLQDELLAVRKAAGTAELVGPGVVVQAYDALEGYRSREIVHERDVRDILNALFCAGAAGAEVGGERIVTQSSVRCAGPVLLVNQQLVPVNPVVVKAVGDPATLCGALGEVEQKFERDGKRLVVRVQESVTLSAHTRGRAAQSRPGPDGRAGAAPTSSGESQDGGI